MNWPSLLFSIWALGVLAQVPPPPGLPPLPVMVEIDPAVHALMGQTPGQLRESIARMTPAERLHAISELKRAAQESFYRENAALPLILLGDEETYARAAKDYLNSQGGIWLLHALKPEIIPLVAPALRNQEPFGVYSDLVIEPPSYKAAEIVTTALATLPDFSAEVKEWAKKLSRRTRHEQREQLAPWWMSNEPLFREKAYARVTAGPPLPPSIPEEVLIMASAADRPVDPETRRFINLEPHDKVLAVNAMSEEARAGIVKELHWMRTTKRFSEASLLDEMAYLRDEAAVQYLVEEFLDRSQGPLRLIPLEDPHIVELLAPAFLRADPLTVTLEGGDVASIPVSFRAAEASAGLLAESSLVSAEVNKWARSVTLLRYEERREAVKSWWKENEKHFRDQAYLALQPGRARGVSPVQPPALVSPAPSTARTGSRPFPLPLIAGALFLLVLGLGFWRRHRRKPAGRD